MHRYAGQPNSKFTNQNINKNFNQNFNKNLNLNSNLNINQNASKNTNLNLNQKANQNTNQNFHIPSAPPIKCSTPTGIQTGGLAANKQGIIKNSSSNQFKTLTNHIASYSTNQMNGKPASHSTGHANGKANSHPVLSHMNSKPVSHPTGHSKTTSGYSANNTNVKTFGNSNGNTNSKIFGYSNGNPSGKTFGNSNGNPNGKSTAMTSKPNGFASNQSNKLASPSKPLYPKIGNSPNMIRDQNRDQNRFSGHPNQTSNASKMNSENKMNNENSKSNNENKLTSSGHKRPYPSDDKLMDLEKSKIRKTLEGIDWNVHIDECSLDVSEIERFKDDTIDFLPMYDLNDPELIRDITDFEFETSMNESAAARAQSNASAPKPTPELAPKPAPNPDDFYGLPLAVKEKLKEERKVERLYEWQDSLMYKLIGSSRNSVYCVPTSGGKTLVAELMIFREIMLNHKNALFIFPFISIVQEKLKSLISFSLEFDFTIEEYAGTKGSIPIAKKRPQNCLYIATYEKAHLLLTCLHEEGRLDEIGLIVIDELHMLGDGTNRGCTLESLLLLCMLAKQRELFNARLLAMSATLSNFDQLAKFLDAEIDQRDFRPVELIEFVMKEQAIYRYDKAAAAKPNSENKSPSLDEVFKFERCLEKRKPLPSDPDNLTGLLEESMPDSPVLIFCATKSNCENIVKLLCNHLPAHYREHKAKERAEILETLREVNDGRVCEILKQGIPFGIVYHHSGLTAEERDIVETNFLEGNLCVIACTSTLSAGVNLPAERVIIRAPYVAKDFISSSQYRQMIGRAGRAGLCNKPGESILIIKDTDFFKIPSLFVTPSLECISSINAHAEQGISRIFLSLIHLGLVENMQQARDVLRNQTLFGIQFSATENFEQILDDLMAKFHTLGLIERPTDEHEKIKITKMGRGAVKSLIDVNKCPKLFDDLKTVSKNISVTSKFHLFYICTLIFANDELPTSPDRHYVHQTYLALSAEEKQAASLMGVNEVTAQGYMLGDNVNDTIRRFFLTLVVNESYQNKISHFSLGLKCGMARGTLQNLLQRFSTNSMSLIRFIEELDENFWGIHSLLTRILSDLCLCSAPELTPFLDLPHVKIGRAKKLYALGYKTLEDIVAERPSELMRKLEYKINIKAATEIIKYAKRVFSTQAQALKLETERLEKLAEIRQSQNELS